MRIKNKKTGAESVVTPEEWAAIQANPHLSQKFVALKEAPLPAEVSKLRNQLTGGAGTPPATTSNATN